MMIQGPSVNMVRATNPALPAIPTMRYSPMTLVCGASNALRGTLPSFRLLIIGFEVGKSCLHSCRGMMLS